MIDKLDAARRQIECSIRLTAAVEDELAVHTLTMAAFGLFRDLAKGSDYFENGINPLLTKIGRDKVYGVAAFLKHADRDPEGVIPSFDPAENDWRIGMAVLVFRFLHRGFTPIMAAFHAWMITRHPDAFNVAEDHDTEFERRYREALAFLHQQPREVQTVSLNALIEAFQQKLFSPNFDYARCDEGASK